MTAYRFCRTDDRALLVAAFESCRGPEDEGEPPLDNEGFKRLVRDLDLWCSSCMVAFEGRDAVGVLLGAKRATTTPVYGLRVHPEHRRQGHGVAALPIPWCDRTRLPRLANRLGQR